MRLVGIFLIISIAATASYGDLVQAKGATPRRHQVDSPQIEIEDVIRAEEDPGFLEYLKERARQERAQAAAALANKKQRQAEEAAYEKARLRFVEERERRKVAFDEEKLEKQLLKEQQAWESEHEKYRRAYVDSRQKQIEKTNIERTARIKKAFSPANSSERLPASNPAPVAR
jgi:hypothetical protein